MAVPLLLTDCPHHIRLVNGILPPSSVLEMPGMGEQARPISSRAAKPQEELERRAAEQGIGPSTLVRMWIKDRLRQVADQSPTGT